MIVVVESNNVAFARLTLLGPVLDGDFDRDFNCGRTAIGKLHAAQSVGSYFDELASQDRCWNVGLPQRRTVSNEFQL